MNLQKIRKCLWHHAKGLAFSYIFCTIVLVAYIEIGSNYGWPYTDVWHPRLHHIYHQIGIM